MRNMIIRTVLDMNNPIVEEPEPTEQSEDTSDSPPVEISPQFDESEQSENDNIIFSDNDDLTVEDFIWSDENTVTVDIDDVPQSKYYLKWSSSYKEACKLIYNKQSKLEDFKSRTTSAFRISDRQCSCYSRFRKAVFHRQAW